jgi:hypothetical protein
VATNVAVLGNIWRRTIMVICTPGEPILPGVRSQPILKGEAVNNSPTNVVFFHFRLPAEAVDGSCILEVCKFIRRPRTLRQFSVTPELHHFDQSFEVIAGASKGSSERVTFILDQGCALVRLWSPFRLSRSDTHRSA